MNPLVSIVVPCFNHAEFLAFCLQSVKGQIFKDWECIVVNDGSLDDTEEVAQSFCEVDSRFSYVHQSNSGLSAARNFGISLAKAPYVLPLDADDAIHERFIQIVLKEIEASESIAYVYTSVNIFHRGTPDLTGSVEVDQLAVKWDKIELLVGNLSTCCAIFRKEDWEKVGGYSENFGQGIEDWDFWIRLTWLLDKKGLGVKERLFFYRQLDGKGMRQNVTANNIADCYELLVETNRDIYVENSVEVILSWHKRFSLLKKHHGMFVYYGLLEKFWVPVPVARFIRRILWKLAG